MFLGLCFENHKINRFKVDNTHYLIAAKASNHLQHDNGPAIYSSNITVFLILSAYIENAPFKLLAYNEKTYKVLAGKLLSIAHFTIAEPNDTSSVTFFINCLPFSQSTFIYIVCACDKL